MSRDVLLFVDLPTGHTVQAAELRFQTNAGGALISTQVRLTEAWLTHPQRYELCPEIALVDGWQRFTGVRSIPGAIDDTAPDRWGRNLMFNAERTAASAEGRRVRTFTEADYVLGVDDRTRLGNLRFSDAPGGPFLSEPRGGVPQMVDLRLLVEAAGRLEAARATPSDLDRLVAAGTSMGGARPKVGVVDAGGELALAKLPQRDDDWDVEAWEAVALRLARSCGIPSPDFTHHRLDADRSVLVSRRFDRAGPRRYGYISADTLLEKRPDEVVSYVELVETAGDKAADPLSLREGLFRRIAFTLLIGNVDDHMKNHGLIRDINGWAWSPVFDVNPWPEQRPVESTPITPGGARTGRSVDELVEAAPSFGLTSDQAVAIVADVEAGSRDWAAVAESFGIEDPAGGVLATAFENDNRRTARSWADRLRIDAAIRDGLANPHDSQGWVRPHLRNGRPVAAYRRRPRR